jgi:hypothetical protein
MRAALGPRSLPTDGMMRAGCTPCEPCVGGTANAAVTLRHMNSVTAQAEHAAITSHVVPRAHGRSLRVARYLYMKYLQRAEAGSTCRVATMSRSSSKLECSEYGTCGQKCCHIRA